MQKWNTPYGELILAPPDIYCIDLRKPMLSSINYWIKSLKLFIYMSPKSSNVIFSEKTEQDAQQRRQELGSTIRRNLQVVGCSFADIGRY